MTVRRLIADGIVLIDDAVGYTDPTSGQGLSVTFADVQMLLHLLLSDSVRNYFVACGTERAAAVYTLVVTAKLNGVDPRAWIAEMLRRIADHPASRWHELLPWN